MRGWIRAIALAAGGAAGAASAGQVPLSTITAPPPVPAIANEGTEVTLAETDSRMTALVSIGQHGPYPFIIDTGAERTVISRELAATLALRAGPPVKLIAMSGPSTVGTVVIPSITVSPIDRRAAIDAPALDQRHIGGPGLIGLDTLADHRVRIDFVNPSMLVTPAVKRQRRPRAEAGEIVVTAKNRAGQLILTEAFFNGRRIKVVLDTGSSVTVGNAAFRRQVARAIQRPFRAINLTSVTGGVTTADYAQVEQLKVGGVVFKGLPVAFADVAPFKRLGLADQPALMLGMDALRAFRRIDIDFPNREVRFLLPVEGRLAAIAGGPPAT